MHFARCDDLSADPAVRALIVRLVCLAGCTGAPWNDPYPAADARRNTLYSAFTERPKHLDPVQSYARTRRLHLADLRAAAAVSLLQATLRVDSADRRGNPAGDYYRQMASALPDDADARPWPTACTRSASSPAYSISRIRHSHRMPPVSSLSRSRRRRTSQGLRAAGFQGDRDPRADRRRLHLPDQAPRQPGCIRRYSDTWANTSSG